MSGLLAGQTCLVTGAGQGLGQPVLSPSCITLEKGKTRPQSDRENAFARVSGGGGGRH